jgi:ATP-dependent protease HslVU (ClpYQ) peptidase subunit
MTCIVGLAQDGKVYIGGDSAGIGGWNLTIRKDKKVFRNGDFLIGGTTSFRMLQLLHHAFVPPVYDPAVDIEKFMTTTFIDAIRECFKAGGYATKNSEQESGGQFLVGFRGRLFNIQNDYQVQEALDGYDAIGCGLEVALGSLHAALDPYKEAEYPRRHIMMALEAAEHHNAGVRGPFYVEVL